MCVCVYVLLLLSVSIGGCDFISRSVVKNDWILICFKRIASVFLNSFGHKKNAICGFFVCFSELIVHSLWINHKIETISVRNSLGFEFIFHGLQSRYSTMNRPAKYWNWNRFNCYGWGSVYYSNQNMFSKRHYYAIYVSIRFIMRTRHNVYG